MLRDKKMLDATVPQATAGASSDEQPPATTTSSSSSTTTTTTTTSSSSTTTTTSSSSPAAASECSSNNSASGSNSVLDDAASSSSLAVSASTADAAAAAAAGPALKEQRAVCAVCDKDAAKYTCPGCSIRFCCVACSKQHKATSGCDGKRRRTHYIGIANFTDDDLVNDYTFLEEGMRTAAEAARRTLYTADSSGPPSAASAPVLPPRLKTLRREAGRRGTRLVLLPAEFSRRRCNTTVYDSRRQMLCWRVEWRFPEINGVLVDEQVDERRSPQEVLEAHLRDPVKGHNLKLYAQAGVPRLHFLLKKEYTPANRVQYYRLDARAALSQVLERKTLIEFPVILVVTDGALSSYALAADEEEWQQQSETGEDDGS